MDSYPITLLGDAGTAQNSWREGGMHIGVCKFLCLEYATRLGQKNGAKVFEYTQKGTQNRIGYQFKWNYVATRFVTKK